MVCLRAPRDIWMLWLQYYTLYDRLYIADSVGRRRANEQLPQAASGLEAASPGEVAALPWSGCDDVLHTYRLRDSVIEPTYARIADVGATLELSRQRLLQSTTVHKPTGRASSRTNHAYSVLPRLKTCSRTSRAAPVCPKAGNRVRASGSLADPLSFLGLTQEEESDVLRRAFEASSAPVEEQQVAGGPTLTA